jgi:hypothetical protein
MSIKTAGVGHFTIPTMPAAGTSCTSGATNTLTTTYVQLIASTTAALFITGIHVEAAAASAATYKAVQLAVGAAGSEAIVDQCLVPLSTGSTVALGYRQIYPPIPVAASARIAVKTADSVGAQATLITLECIAQTNVVADGILISGIAGTTNTFDALQTAINTTHGAGSWATATGFATPTNITAGTITTVTNLTNAPTTGDLTATMKTSVTTAATAATPTAAAVTGAVGSVTGLTASDVGTIKTAIGVAGAGLTALGDTRIANLDAAVSSRSTYAGGAVASVTGAVGSVTAAVSVTGDLTATMKTSVTTAATAATPTITLPAIPTNWITAAGITAAALNGKGDWNTTTPPTAATIAGATWDVALSGHLTAGTTGLALNSSGASGDPWSTALPGAYATGTAGKILGAFIKALDPNVMLR